MRRAKSANETGKECNEVSKEQSKRVNEAVDIIKQKIPEREENISEQEIFRAGNIPSENSTLSDKKMNVLEEQRMTREEKQAHDKVERWLAQIRELAQTRECEDKSLNAPSPKGKGAEGEPVCEKLGEEGAAKRVGQATSQAGAAGHTSGPSAAAGKNDDDWGDFEGAPEHTTPSAAPARPAAAAAECKLLFFATPQPPAATTRVATLPETTPAVLQHSLRELAAIDYHRRRVHLFSPPHKPAPKASTCPIQAHRRMHGLIFRPPSATNTPE
jgi:hypothetical protein